MSLEVGPTLSESENVENYPLTMSRSKEIGKVQEALKDSPFIFVWAPSGNGKTGFGREMRSVTPSSQLILEPQLVHPSRKFRLPYEDYFNESASLTIVDEFAPEENIVLEMVHKYLLDGMQFVFMTHYPKSRYIEWRKQHKRRLQPMIQLINEFPNALWLYLSKWKSPSQ